MKIKFTTYHLCMIAFAIVLNIVGGHIALALRLPIYLDSIGTILIAATCGCIYGMIPNLISGVVLFMTGDPFSLYYAPVGMLLGFLMGLVLRKEVHNFWKLFLIAFVVTVPTSFLAACITAYLFGGITSSGSSYIVLLLSKLGVNLTVSCFIVQVITDYADKLLALILVWPIIKKLPTSILTKLKGNND